MSAQYSRFRALFVRSLKSVYLRLCLIILFMIGILLVTLVHPAQAATNSNLNFQARLQTAGGGIVPDGYYNVEFKLYSASSGGAALWTETHYDSNGVTAGNDNRIRVKNGYLTANLGSLTAFPAINWDQDLWITMNVGGSAQTATPTYDGEMTPRLKLTGVPYAFKAGQLATGNGTLQSTLQILQPTVGNQVFQIQDQAAAGTYNLCIQNSTACGFAPSSGSANYIQNTTSPQSANLNVVGTASSGVAAGTFRANSTGNAILDLYDSAGGFAGGFDQFGNLYVGNNISSNTGIYADSYNGGATPLAVRQLAAGATAPVVTFRGGATPGAGADLLQLQNSGSQSLAGFDSAGQLYLGRAGAGGASGSLKLYNATNANTVTLQSATTSSSYSLTLPTALGSTDDCLKDTGSGVLGFASCAPSSGSVNYIQNQNAADQTANFRISGTARANTSVLTPLLDVASAGTLSLGTATANAISIGSGGMTTTVNGSLTVANGINASGTYTTSNNNRVNIAGTLNSSTTTSQYGIQNNVAFNPSGASLSNIYGFVNTPSITGSSLGISNYYGMNTSISTAAGYTGQVSSGGGLQVGSPTISGSQLIPSYAGIVVNSNTGNTGNTTGTINNYQLRLLGNTAAAASGGTLNNYGAYIQQPSGSGAGTTNNYGLYLTGNGAGSSNYAIYNDSTAANYLQGNTSIGTTSSSAKLDISAGTTQGLHILNSNQSPYALMINNATFGSTNSTGFGFWQGNDGAGNIDVNGTNRIKIDSTGNVGIGGTASVPLDVYGNTYIRGTNFNANTGAPALSVNGAYISIGDPIGSQTLTNGVGIKFHDTGAAHASLKYLSSANRFDFCGSSAVAELTCDASTETLSVDIANGRVGVGTATPAYKLDVAGDINTTTQYRIAGAVQMTSSSLVFTATTVATIQSANTYALTVDSGTTGALNFGTGANAKTITLGNNTGATSLFLNAGSGGINLGLNSNNPINIATGTSTSLVSLGNGNGTFALNTTNIDISAAGAITGVTGIAIASGNFSQTGTGTFSTGTGSVSLNSDTTVRSDSTTAFQVQNAAGTVTFLTVNAATQRLTLRALSDAATVGGELMTGSFPATTGWTAISGTGQTATATHTNGGGTTALSPTPALSISAGVDYRLDFTISGLSTNGTMSVSLGGFVVNGLRGNGTYSYVVNASTTGNLIFAPTNSFNGTVSAVSVRSAAAVGIAFSVADSSGGNSVTMRVNQSSLYGTYLGNAAGSYSGTGIGNTGIGAFALQDNHSGDNNTGIGRSALTATNGDDNTAIGYRSGGQLIAGSQNTAIGSSALYNVKSGTGNTALGYNAGYQDTSGYTTASDLTNVTLIGNQAQSSVDNSLILGGAGILDAAGSSAVRVGIGTNRPVNIFSVMPTLYDTGTITQSGTTVTGTGTTFTASMVGSRFTTTGGTSAVITAFTSTTSITINVSQTIASASNYRIHRLGFQVTDQGAVGVGTEAPGYRFDVVDNQATNYVARIQNTNTANTADGLLIDLGVAVASRGTGNYFVGFSGAGTVAGKIQGGASAVAYTTTAADYAEYFRADPDDLPAAAELVQIDTANANGVVRSGADMQRNLVGVISTNPGFIGNGPLCLTGDEDCDSNYAKYNALVALSGQVPVKVNASKGAIAIGDPITVSAVPGEGAKATAASYIVGYAQEALAGDSGIIKVLIRPQYYTPQPSTELTQQVSDLQSQVEGFGSLLNTGSLQAGSLTVTGNATIKGDLLVLGKTIVRELQIEGHIISKGELPTVELQSAAGRHEAVPDADKATVTVTGNDTAGVITVRAGEEAQGSQLVKLKFDKLFAGIPQVLITPVGQSGAGLQAYIDDPADDGFGIGVVNLPQPGQTYRFNYYVIQ